MSKTLHLHIGSPKTGTTYLQQVLFSNNDKLEQQGYCYPGDEFSHQKLFFATNCPRRDWARQFRGKKKKVVEQIVGRYFKTLEKELRNTNCNEVIMSAEDFFMANDSYIQNLKNYLADFFSDVKVYVFIRNPVQYYRSFQQEMIKARSYIVAPHAFDYGIKDVIEVWRNRFDTEVIGYYSGRDSLAVFSDAVGFSINSLTTEGVYSNSSTSIEQMALLEKINSNLYPDQDDILRVHLKSITQINAPFTSKPELQEWVKPVIHQNHQRDLRWLKNQFGIDFNLSYSDQRPPSNLDKGRQLGVRDVYKVEDEGTIEKYESLVIDALLKQLLQ